MKQTSTYPGPLAGLNVIDFGHYYAGPMAAMLLADQGANVIRILRPGDSDSSVSNKELPEQQYRLLNRNKKLLQLDLKTEAGKAQALELIEKADVVIENFRPGVMKRLGLDYATVKDHNPGLIYLSLPGFASTDKERASIQAWEGVLGAAAGVYTMTSEFREMLHFPPVYTAVPQCSTYGAMHGAMGIMAALVAREQCGFGTVIEVPLVEAGFTAFEGDIYGKRPFYTLRALTEADAQTDIDLPASLRACRYLPEDSPSIQAEKIERARRGFMPLYFMYQLYPCADGREIYIYLSYSFADRLMKLLSIDEQVKREGFVIENPWEFSLGNNIGSFGSGLTAERKERLIKLIGDALLTKPAVEWETLMTDAGIHAAVLRTREEWLALEAHKESGFLAEMKHGDSLLTVPGRLAGVSGPEGQPIDPVLREAEFITIAEAQDLLKHHKPYAVTENRQLPLQKGELLKGLKVVDLANFVAGPTISVHLAEFGAEVIKMDPPRYDAHCGALQLVTNQGKRSLLVELSTAPGREIFRRLVSWADVVTHNSVDGTAERLGATYEQLRTMKPEVVVCQMGAYCGPYRGGWGARGGNEPLIQANCGIMVQFGSLEQAQRHSQVGIGDVPGGYCGAFTALLGVYQQRRTGRGSECRTALGQVANHVQLPYMMAENGRSDWGEPTGQFALGAHDWQRLYRCRDGWIFLDARESGAAVLAETVSGQREANVQQLESAFAECDSTHWLDLLAKAGIACHRVLSVEGILEKEGVRAVDNQAADEQAHGAGEILCWKNHPCGYPFNMLAPDSVRVGENHSYRRIIPAPRLGAHSVEILRELGYSDKEVDQLVKHKVVHEYFPALGGKEAFLFPVKS